jgi:hypothetical protein
MPLRLSTRFTISIALWIVVLAAVWPILVPGTLSPSTYVMVATLLTAMAGIAMKTYMGGQASDSLATLLYNTDIAPATAPSATSAAGRGPAPRVDL